MGPWCSNPTDKDGGARTSANTEPDCLDPRVVDTPTCAAPPIELGLLPVCLPINVTRLHSSQSPSSRGVKWLTRVGFKRWLLGHCAEPRCRRDKMWDDGNMGEVQPIHEDRRVGQASLQQVGRVCTYMYAAGHGWWNEAERGASIVCPWPIFEDAPDRLRREMLKT
jgi:hypothetical protein